MLKYIVTGIFLIVLSTTAAAEINRTSSAVSVSVPGQKWQVTIPSSNLELQQEKRRADGHGVYYFFSDSASSINISIYIEKTDKCTSAKTCRDMFWKNPGPGYSNARDVVLFDQGDFSGIQCIIENAGGTKVTQANISAHAYFETFWVDIHISKVGASAPSLEPLMKMLESISIEKSSSI